MAKNAAFRNGQANYFGTQFDGGTIDLLDASSAVLATIALPADAFGAASAGQIAVRGGDLPIAFAGTAAAGAGTDIASATLKSSDALQEISGLTVGTTTAHIVLDNTNIADTQNGEITSFTINVPADIQAA